MNPRPIVCQKCARSLFVPPRGSVPCRACGHVHEPAADPTEGGDPGEDFEPGNAVLVEWGGRFWPGTVLRALGGGTWEIAYRDWPASYHEVVDYKRIRWAPEEVAATRIVKGTVGIRGNLLAAGFAIVLALGLSVPLLWRYVTGTAGPPPVAASGTPVTEGTPLRLGQAVLVAHDGGHYRARYLRPESGGKVNVLRIGYGSESTLDVPRSALLLPPESERLSFPPAPRPVERPGAPVADPSRLPIGARVQALWHGRWLAATVVAVEGGQPKVHFDGFSTDWDHTPPAGGLRAETADAH